MIKLAETLLQPPSNKEHCFIGFDGFTDHIASAVKQRTDEKNYTPYETISDFGNRILEAASKSCNVELVVHETKVGGNAPILAQALLKGGHRITLAAAIGEKEVEPIFASLAKQCEEVILLGLSGHTDAIEFKDGKILLGKLENIQKLTLERVLNKIGKTRLVELLDRSLLIISANWTMLSMTNGLWEYIGKEVAPHLKKKKRFFFVDLADPAKRSDADLKKAIELLSKLPFEVVLGLNIAEAERVAGLLGIKIAPKDRTSGEAAAKALKEASKLGQIVIHTKSFAAVATSSGVFSTNTFLVEKPKVSTGAGDNFNAGYCHGLLLNLEAQDCLILGVATGGYYVREGKSPTMEELAFFLKSWDKDKA